MNTSPLLRRILAPGGVRVVFQPILEWNAGWRLHAFESLVRGPAGTNLEPAEVLFGYTRRKQAEVTVDRACVEAVLRAARRLGVGTRLTLNVHGTTIERDRTFPAFVADRVAEAGFRPQDITIEIVEHSATDGGPAFVRGLSVLRESGMAIAIDDIGLGQSNYRMLLVVRPDYFKLDRFLIKGSASDPYRRAILRSLGELAASVGAWSVGEGVDNVDDLDAVLASGLRLIQGYLLASPATAECLGSTRRVEAVTAAMPPRPDDGAGDGIDWLHGAMHLTAGRGAA